MMELSTKTDSDLIIEYLVTDQAAELSPKLEEKLKRYQQIADLIHQYGSRNKVVPMAMKMFGIKRTQAHQDFFETQKIFGSRVNLNREFWIDVVLGQIMKTKDMAIKRKDSRAAAQADKNLVTAVEKLLGDKDTMSFDQIQPVNILMGFFPETTKVNQLSEQEIEQAYKQLSKTKRKIDILDVEAS
ncbi:hypothetical protein [Chondrinema litorale]|uniref:hypothetical protein n=1 Tax=Chondrinema litorale TaxID=2994555 RepID=UPI002543666C|nr:hypothetical protein [Chondrinema litorale]UZR95939.1 hypothetical protein OQ292_08950 [Chondrinema litorale]